MNKSKIVIHAIKHYDFYTQPNTKVSIVDRGLDEDHVTLKLVSQPGQIIQSLFRFYGEYIEE